jgi:hypothetical protein
MNVVEIILNTVNSLLFRCNHMSTYIYELQKKCSILLRAFIYERHMIIGVYSDNCHN